MKHLTQQQILGLVSACSGLALMLIVIISASSNPYFTEDWGYHVVFGFGMLLTIAGIFCTNDDK